ncbi:MAG: VCBS repeat-containing protein [Deltaproteobacteria bacterium]|nr:MAG: VCBS repeat-containing protein [Deltaproteobacteria bacterium]
MWILELSIAHGGDSVLLSSETSEDGHGAEYTVGGVVVTIPLGTGSSSDIVVSSEPTSDDEDIIFSSPYAGSGRGMAVVIPRSLLSGDVSFIGHERSPSVSALTSSAIGSESTTPGVILYGSEDGDHFGAYVATGDINGDGNIEYLFAAPGEGAYGAVHIYDQDLTEIATILGSADQPINSIIVAQVMGGSAADIILGPDNHALNADLTTSSALTLSQYSSRITVVEGSSSLSGTINLSESDSQAVVGTGNTYQSVTTGDVNGDSYNDIIASTSNSVAIFLGPITAATHISYDNASYIITGEGGYFGQSLNTGDVNHDDIDDILIGAPGEGDYGSIYILFGRYFWDSDSITSQISLELASKISGTTGTIGSDMLVHASDSGALTLYTSENETSTLELTLSSTKAIDQTGEISVGGSSSAIGCNFIKDTNHEDGNIYYISILAPLILIRLFKGSLKTMRKCHCK